MSDEVWIVCIAKIDWSKLWISSDFVSRSRSTINHRKKSVSFQLTAKYETVQKDKEEDLLNSRKVTIY